MKKRVFCILLTGMMAAMLAACGGTSDNQESRATAMTEPQATAAESQMTETTESETETETEPADALTLEQKVGQLFIVRPDALDPSQESDQVNDAEKMV